MKRNNVTMSTQPSDSKQITLFKSDEPADPYKKAVQVVHAKPSVQLSLIQAKMSNVLLKNAHETTIDEEGFFTISKADIRKAMGFDSHNWDYLHASARAITKINFEYDVYQSRSGKAQQAFSALFPELLITESDFRYQISARMREHVLRPEMWAMIDMNVLRKFKKAASVPLYEHCVRYVKLGKTARTKLDDFRDVLLGAKSGDGLYKEYKYFKARVLKPSITEINLFSDIIIGDILVTRRGQSIDQIEFLVSKKPLADIVQASEADQEKLEVELALLGISSIAIRKYIKDFNSQELFAAIDYTKKRLSDKRAKPIENTAAYFKQALDRGYGIVDAPAGESTKVSDPAKEAEDGLKEIKLKFEKHQIDEAKRYYETMDESDKQISYVDYNDQQSIDFLKIVPGKKTKTAVQSAYLRWLAIYKWGVPTDSHLLEFAIALAAKRGKK